MTSGLVQMKSHRLYSKVVMPKMSVMVPVILLLLLLMLLLRCFSCVRLCATP